MIFRLEGCPGSASRWPCLGQSVLFPVGPLLDTSTLFLMAAQVAPASAAAVYLAGLPVNGIHAGATAFFLFVAGPLMLEKLDRVQLKYGLTVEKERCGMRIESCHPGVIALYFAAMLAFTGWFQQPVFLALSLGTAVVVTGFLFRDGLWKRLGWTATAGGVVFLWARCSAALGTPCSGGALGQPGDPGGIGGYSATLWVRVTAALLWCGCLFRLVPVDKIIGGCWGVLPPPVPVHHDSVAPGALDGFPGAGDSGDPDLLRSENGLQEGLRREAWC